MLTSTVVAQASQDSAAPVRVNSAASDRIEERSAAPAVVDVTPVARDEEIGRRLQSVLDATGWFTGAQVRVDAGVVFLSGHTESEELRVWAGDLARNTQAVVAVANRIEVPPPDVWDLRPAWSGLLALWREFVHSLPFLIFAMIILALSVGAGIIATRAVAAILLPRVEAQLLRSVLARGAGVLVVLAGTYVVLRISGLTQLALTVVGGTGLVGLALGIAFRDITENFLASIFLSMQRPFETGDLVEIAGVTGYVQQLNVRTTILMTLDGNLVQIPNATVYKSNLRNFTSSANRREDFIVGIDYATLITDAQEIARQVLTHHPAVLQDPEPSVLVDSLGPSTVNLRVYFWLNGREHSWMKVRSSVLRLVKRAFQEQGITMPDDAREVIFPQGVPVTLIDRTEAAGVTQGEAAQGQRPAAAPAQDTDAVSTQAEAGLYSEAVVLEAQARQAQTWKAGENLLPAQDPSTRSP
ncbi:MAG TPA: mechanosensitive ion channel family protein [Arenimonas sp.]|nr:mechanosensitive ion channel family protein [Arenimonas sp.]